ncbi:MAG: DUF3574 domain-containing protein [Pseudomonadota bacterium]
MMFQTTTAWRVASALVVMLLLNGCAASRTTACRPGEEFAVQDALYFGTGIPDDGVVTPEDWSMFLTATVTPRFPQGLTVSQASGQWRGEDGSIVQETSYVLELVHPDDVMSEQAVAEIISAYKTQFRQEAVLRVKHESCISF